MNSKLFVICTDFLHWRKQPECNHTDDYFNKTHKKLTVTTHAIDKITWNRTYFLDSVNVNQHASYLGQEFNKSYHKTRHIKLTSAPPKPLNGQ